MSLRNRRVAWAVLAGLATAAAAVLAAGPASAAAGTGEIRHAGGPTAVPDSYLVVLRDARAAVSTAARGAGGYARRQGRPRLHRGAARLRGLADRVRREAAGRTPFR